MFTGLIESVGKVKSIKSKNNYLVLTVSHNLIGDETKIGDSIACDGCCLTVVALDKNELTFEISQETIERTIAGDYHQGRKINLERAVIAGNRMGGHFVTGHIDTIATLTNKNKVGDSVELQIKYNEEYNKLVVPKGSIAINGVSLTVNEAGNGLSSVNLIPHTLAHTNFEQLNINDKVNVEFDLVGKYALNADINKTESTLTFDKLTESGW